MAAPPPAISSLAVAPLSLRLGEQFSVEVDATGASSGSLFVDFRPTAPKLLRLPLSFDGTKWVGGGQIPTDIVLQNDVNITFQAILMNATGQRGQKSKAVLLHRNPPSPKITWSQNQIEVTLSTGESTEKDLTFSSTLALQDVVIEPVPEIAPFLSVQPGALASVPADQDQPVRLSVHVPAGATLGTYEGTVHIRSGTRTVPQTVKVIVNAWNESAPTAGLTFNFPPFERPSQIRVDNRDNGDTLIRFQLQNTEGVTFTAFGILMRPKSLTVDLQQWFDENVDIDGVLMSSGAFEEQQLQNGLPALIAVRPIPIEYQGGPIEEGYMASPTGDRIISIAQSNATDIDEFGYTQQAVIQMMRQVLGAIKFVQ